MIEVKENAAKLISEGNHTNKGKSSLTLLLVCLILRKVYFKNLLKMICLWFKRKRH